MLVLKYIGLGLLGTIKIALLISGVAISMVSAALMLISAVSRLTDVY